LISQRLAFTDGFAIAATCVTRDSIATLTVATGMARADCFAVAATCMTRDSVAAITVTTCMTVRATTCMRVGMLEDFSLYSFHYNYDCFLSLTITGPAFTATAVTDIKKQTTSKMPSIFLICFNILLSPFFYFLFLLFNPRFIGKCIA
jgi:hypothetical protein